MYAYDPNGSAADERDEYEVVTASESYVEPFKHIELEGRLLWPGRSYFRALDADWWRLKEENGKLKEAMARSGNTYFLTDANRWKSRNTSLEMKNAALEAQLLKAKAELEIQCMKLQAEADFWKMQYDRLAEMNSGNNSSRDSRSGRWKAKDGMSLEKKQDKALEMYEDRIGYARIGESLGISAETAKIYIRQARERRAKRQVLEDFEKKKQKQMGE